MSEFFQDLYSKQARMVVLRDGEKSDDIVSCFGRAHKYDIHAVRRTDRIVLAYNVSHDKKP